MRRRRNEYLDARITQTAIDLFVLGRNMLSDGVDPSSREWCEVAFSLNRALKLPPWAEVVLDLEAYDIAPAKLESSNWKLPRQLHRQLAAAHRVKGANEGSGMARCLFNVRFPAWRPSSRHARQVRVGPISDIDHGWRLNQREFRPDYTNAGRLPLVSYRRQFKLENRASGCPGRYPNPTVMVFND